MSNNKNIINGAKVRKNPLRDEFYTTKESAYRLKNHIAASEFAGKTVYCCCDESWSEIYKLFKDNFKYFNLKGLVATAYRRDNNGVKTTFDGNNEVATTLAGDGDFRSDECKEIMKQCDIVVTNPPFSLQNVLLEQIYDLGKDFAVICNPISLLNKGKNSIVWKMQKSGMSLTNFGKSGGMSFFCKRDSSIIRITTMFITSLNATYDQIRLQHTYKQLEEKGKIEFDDATGIVNINRNADIPNDYFGEMYVPSSLLYEDICKHFDLLDISGNVIVKGKRKFWRVLVKRKLQ